MARFLRAEASAAGAGRPGFEALSASPGEGWLQRDGVDLHYVEWGREDASSQPAILLLHGLSSNALYWARTAAHLRNRHVVALDQRGHGLTGSAAHRPPASDGYSMDELVRDVAFVAGELALDRPVVAGHSWGAGVALETVARHTELASGLAFIDGPLQGVASIFDWAEVETFMQPPLPRYASVEDAVADSKRDFAEAWAEDLMPFVEARVMRDGDAWVLTLTSPIRLELLRGLFDSRPEELWPLVRVPAVALMANIKTARISRSTETGIERLHEIAPTVAVIRFDTPHDIPIYAPAKVAHVIDQVARLALDRCQPRSTT